MYSVQYTVHKMNQATTPVTPGERLSRLRILETALALVKSDGLDALSMRRLAQALDVWPMSLYRYFHDKDALVAAVADAAAENIAPPTGDAPWPEQMRELLGQARAIFESHPGSLRPQDDGPAAARVRNAGLAILKRAGITGAEAESAWQTLLAYTAGAAGFDLSAEEYEYGLARLLTALSTTHSDVK